MGPLKKKKPLYLRPGGPQALTSGRLGWPREGMPSLIKQAALELQKYCLVYRSIPDFWRGAPEGSRATREPQGRLGSLARSKQRKAEEERGREGEKRSRGRKQRRRKKRKRKRKRKKQRRKEEREKQRKRKKQRAEERKKQRKRGRSKAEGGGRGRKGRRGRGSR